MSYRIKRKWSLYKLVSSITKRDDAEIRKYWSHFTNDTFYNVSMIEILMRRVIQQF